MLRKHLIAGVALGLILTLLFGTVGAVASPARTYRTLATVPDRRVGAYPTVAVHTERSSPLRARLIDGVTYVAVRDLAEAYGGLVSYAADTRTATLTLGKRTVTVRDGAYAVWVDGRPLFATTPSVTLSNGSLYAPIRPLATAFGLTVSWSAATRSVTLTGQAEAHRSTPAYTEDEVLWLARIISAEARGEELLGQIAVGSVVLNRTRHESYPSTIWGVIFDRRFGVQFSPVANGTIYQSPTESAVMAARICLEGFSVSADALFFLEPSKSTSLWIPQNRPYLFTVGHHDFYA